MSEWTELDFEARRAAHRRGHSKPLRNRAAIDRSYDAVASSTVGISVAQFAPNGELTDANIDDAIDAAIAQAIDLTGPGLEGPGYAISFPAGKWTLSRPHVIPAFGEYRCAVGLEGAGMNDTIFLVESDDAASAAFTFGTAEYSGSGVAITVHLRVRNFSVLAALEGDCNRTGIRCYGAVNPLIQGVRVRGLVSASTTYSQGRGIEILPVIENGSEVNSQFVDIRNCDVYGCMTGIFIRLSYPCTLDNVHSQGCLFENAVFEGCTVRWSNSGIQFGSQNVYPERWYGNRDMPAVVTGFSSTSGLGSGAGATCGAQSDRLCLVTGLSGLNESTDVARWLELIPAGATSNELKVRGVYKIDQVVSASSCYIRKGSDHTSQGSLSWQLRESAGAVTLTLSAVYNETANKSTIGMWRPNSGSTSLVITEAEFQGGDFCAEACGIRSVTIRGVREGNTATKRVQLLLVDWSDIEADISDIECDDHSYFGLVCRDNASFPSGDGIGHVRSSDGGTQVRFRSALKDLGAVAIWDARVASSLTLDGSEVDAVTDVVNGIQLVLYGQPGTYDPADTEFDGPCVAHATGSGGTLQGLTAVIPADVLPTSGYSITLVAVARNVDGTIESDRVIMASSDGGVGTLLGLNNGVALPTGFTATYSSNYMYPPNQGQAYYDATSDTDAHVFVQSAANPNLPDSQMLSWDREIGIPGGIRSTFPWNEPGQSVRVSIASVYGGSTSGSMRWVVVAVIPRSLSVAEHQKIIDLARNEWPLAES